MRQRLEAIGATFIRGYNLALECDSPGSLVIALNAVEPELRGFAFEGAAMGLALLDCLTPWKSSRIRRFLEGGGDPHAYMVHVAVGWVWARLPFDFLRGCQRLDALLGWLAYDGWGFHEGFFHWPQYVDGQPPPKRLGGYATRAFDQGLGRSWWFVNGGNPELIARTIGNFSTLRQADLWSGVGLAATYAGMVEEAALRLLRESASSFWPCLGQGAAFAAKARQRAGNLTEYTDVATRVFCNLPACDAARLCDQTLENLPANGAEPAFAIWRNRIQDQLRESRKLEKTEPLLKVC
jgi:hypothetical protein